MCSITCSRVDKYSPVRLTCHAELRVTHTKVSKEAVRRLPHSLAFISSSSWIYHNCTTVALHQVQMSERPDPFHNALKLHCEFHNVQINQVQTNNSIVAESPKST